MVYQKNLRIFNINYNLAEERSFTYLNGLKAFNAARFHRFWEILECADKDGLQPCTAALVNFNNIGETETAGNEKFYSTRPKKQQS